MKKSRMYTRKCLALRWALLALAFLLMVNHLLGICLLLPIQTAHRSADLQGIGRTHLVERRWEPELRATGLLYLMENENALLMTDTHLGLLGWETERGSAVDCTGDAPLYVGQYDAVYDDRMVNCYFGRIDDPTIELLTRRPQSFTACLWNGRRLSSRETTRFFGLWRSCRGKEIRNGRTDIRLFLPMTPKETW